MDSERDTSSVGNPGRGRPLWQAKLGLAGWTLAGIGILSQAGCMSAITATTLREALRETAASLSAPHDLDHASTARVDRPVADVEAEDAENSPGDDAQLEQVIDNAVARLSAAGGIDTPTQELLIKTLEQTRPEDWAVVVNEFAKTLEASRGSIAADDAADGGILARPRTGGVLELDIPARARPSADAPPLVAELAAAPVELVAAVDLSGIPLLQVAPIVVAPAPADGHTTGIDASFRLIDAGGERVGQWAFEPIVETCPAPRRDYFARYFIRIPEDAKPGRHRLEWSVTDTVAEASRQAHLDLDVVAE